MRYLRAKSVVLVGLLSACGASRSNVASSPEPSAKAIQVQIDNQNYSDMDVYVLQSGQRLLVGQAGGLSQTTLTIQNVIQGGGRIRLLAQPIGAVRPIRTPTLVVPPGESIFWTIGSDTSTSSAYTG